MAISAPFIIPMAIPMYPYKAQQQRIEKKRTDFYRSYTTDKSKKYHKNHNFFVRMTLRKRNGSRNRKCLG